MTVIKSPAPRKNWLQALNENSGAGLRESVQIGLGNIPSTGVFDRYVIVIEDGYLHSAAVVYSTSLNASDSTYITYSLTNLGQSGVGSVPMLLNSPENTTKLTGGVGITAFIVRLLKTSSDPKILAVKAGDVLKFTHTITGNVNVLDNGLLLVRFNP